MSPRAWMIATACVACAEPPSAHTDDQGSYALELRAELSVRGPDQAWQTSGLQMTATLGLADEAMALREVSCRPTQASGSLAQVERACRGLEATYGLAREPSGRLITIGLPDGLTMEGEALIKQLAGLLQLSVPPGAGSGWTTEEFDHMGTYVAHYGRTDRAITRTHEDYAQVASGEGLRPVGPTELRGAATTQWTFDDAGAWRSVVHTSTWQREALAEAGLPESRVETSLLLEREGEPVPLLEPQVLTWVAPFAQSSEAAVQDSIDRHRLGTVAPEAWLDRVLIANLSSDPTPHSDTPLVDQAFLTLVSVFRQRADLLDRSVAPCVDANPDRAETCRVVTGALGAAGTPEAQDQLIALATVLDGATTLPPRQRAVRRREVSRALGTRLHGPASDATIDQLSAWLDDAVLRPQSAYGLGAIASRQPDRVPLIVGRLGPLLDHSEPQIIQIGLRALANAGHPSIEPLVTPFLDDENPATRKAAAQAMDRITAGRPSTPGSTSK